MIRHTVLLTFEGADDAVVDTVVASLRELPRRIPQIAAYTVGRDLGLSGNPPTVVVVGDFADVDDYRSYSAHPDHVRVLDDHIRPHATAINRAQIALD